MIKLLVIGTMLSLRMHFFRHRLKHITAPALARWYRVRPPMLRAVMAELTPPEAVDGFQWRRFQSVAIRIGRFGRVYLNQEALLYHEPAFRLWYEWASRSQKDAE